MSQFVGQVCGMEAVGLAMFQLPKIPWTPQGGGHSSVFITNIPTLSCRELKFLRAVTFLLDLHLTHTLPDQLVLSITQSFHKAIVDTSSFYNTKGLELPYRERKGTEMTLTEINC